jgi:hypothetical protein
MTNPTAYIYDKNTNEYLGATQADPSPLEEGVWIYPAFTTDKKPPDAGANQAVVFNGDSWALVPDWRKHTYWLADGSEHTIEALGEEPPADALDAPPPPAPPTAEQIIAGFTAAIQKRLDDFAKTRNYDSILSACTYATSTVPTFAAEGQAAVDLRDATWAKAYEILNAVQAGKQAMPTEAELMAQLPAQAWPQ